MIFSRNGIASFRTQEKLLDTPRRYLHTRKTTEWRVSTQSHVVTVQALGESIQYREFPLRKESMVIMVNMVNGHNGQYGHPGLCGFTMVIMVPKVIRNLMVLRVEMVIFVELVIMVEIFIMGCTQIPISTLSHIWVFVRLYGIVFVIIVIIVIIIIMIIKSEGVIAQL